DLRFEQRHLLEPGPLAVDDVAAGLDARGFELVGDILDDGRLDRRGGPTSLEGVGRQLLVDLRQTLGAEGAEVLGGDGNSGDYDCGGKEPAGGFHDHL